MPVGDTEAAAETPNGLSLDDDADGDRAVTDGCSRK